MDDLERDIFKRLESLVGRVDDLLGSDQATESMTQLADLAHTIAAQLRDPNPAAAEKAIHALAGLVDINDPADAATPLGVAVARTDHYATDLLTQAEAGHLLGMSRQRVNDLMRRPNPRLDKAGVRVTRGSVARELARRSSKPRHVIERIDRDGKGVGEYLTDLSGWADLYRARRFPSILAAREVARQSRSFARAVTVRPDEDDT